MIADTWVLTTPKPARSWTRSENIGGTSLRTVRRLGQMRGKKFHVPTIDGAIAKLPGISAHLMPRQVRLERMLAERA